MLTTLIILCLIAFIWLLTRIYKLDSHYVKIYIESRSDEVLEQVRAMNEADETEQFFIMAKNTVEKERVKS